MELITLENLKYDGQLHIATAPSRTAAKWKNKTLEWSQLISQLSETTRTRETLAEYRKMAKTKQDDIKDVGGFVGGWLKQGLRKADSLEHRSLITLDADFATMDLLDSVGLLYGCAAAVYSTHKHTPDEPRLRLLVPLSRTVSGDEYQAVSRMLAQDIGIDLFDDTTYQPTRLMYWPSTSADADYHFDVNDGPWLDPDTILVRYPDWRDTSYWPESSRAVGQRKKLADKQGDPTAKPGVIGAFCRTYTVEEVISLYLADKYTPCSTENRYTYTGGSTAAGLVVYDGGLFAYSNHATDPASGRLCNAFDLVRLHLFGAQDTDSEEDTLVTKLPSYKAMVELAQKDDQVRAILASEKLQEIQADFGEDIVTDENTGLEMAACDGKNLSLNTVEVALQAMGISARLNQITTKLEIQGMPAQYSEENSSNTLPVLLLDVLLAVGIKRCTKTAIADYLSNICDINRVNPVHEMMTSAPWDGVQRIPKIFSILGVASSREKVYIRKWLLQTVAMAMNDFPAPYGAEGVLVLQGPEGIGKTRFFSVLAYDSRWFREGLELNTDDKDSLIRATSCWIGELGELDSTVKRQQAALKAFITASADAIRMPYAREASQRARRTSYCGTVNPGEFLLEEAGSRRFWVIPVTSIDLQAINELSAPWIQQLWAEVYAMWQKNPQGFRLTSQERQELNISNERFKKLLPGELEVRELLDFDLPNEQWKPVFASQMLSRIYPVGRITAQQVGYVLAKLAKEHPEMEPEKDRARRTQYKVPLPGDSDFQ